jgi:membrane-bound serine protease (ClpP class)
VRPDGHVAVRGELWEARSEDGEPLEPGEEVEVVGLEGLALVVRRAREAAHV